MLAAATLSERLLYPALVAATVMDMVYIAFAMPLSAAFCPVVLGGLNWCSSVDLAAGRTCRHGGCGWWRGVLIRVEHLTVCVCVGGGGREAGVYLARLPS